MGLNNKPEGSFYTISEEIGNAVTHGLGAVLSIIGTVIIIIYSAGNTLNIVASAVYGFSMILLFSFSCLYHSITNIRAKQVLRVFDHSTIYILIAGTYTPLALITLKGAVGFTIFSIVWAIAILGIILNIISIERFYKISQILYIISGWVVVFALIPLFRLLPWQGIVLLFVGGFFYTFGTIFYRKKGVDYMHFIWHFFVLAGAVCHYFCILFYVL